MFLEAAGHREKRDCFEEEFSLKALLEFYFSHSDNTPDTF